MAAVSAVACRGYIDTEDYVNPDDMEQTDPTKEVPEGVLRIFADTTEIMADGNETVTFTVMFGSEDVSNAKTLQLIRIFNGEEKYMAYGVNKFSTVTAGTYTFKAEYYYSGKKFSDNEIEIVAEQYFIGEEKEYKRRYLGTLFTSTGCTSCPLAALRLSELQATNPGEISLVSFHADMNGISDPMTNQATADFRAALGGFTGLPTFFWNMRKSSETGGPDFKSSFDKEKDAYETFCGVAIETSYDEDSRKLEIELGVTSNMPTVFRYLVFLVEDNIPAVGDYEQAGKDGDYIHYNVVRKALTGTSGDKLNDGLPLAVGVEARAKKSVTLDKAWDAENMRVVVAAMSSEDGGVNWTANNVNECKVGESVSYEGPDTPVNPGTDSDFQRQVCLIEFTEAHCIMCPDGFSNMMGVLSKPSLKKYKDFIHIAAFHSDDLGEDPFALDASKDIFGLFDELTGYPAYVTDLRNAGGLTKETISGLQPSLEASFNDYPAHCGVAVSSTPDSEKTKTEIEVKVTSAKTTQYRVVVLVVEDGIKGFQKSYDYPDGKDDHTHKHVVRQVVTTYVKTFTGEKLTDDAVIEEGVEKSKTWEIEIGVDWNLEKTQIYALVLDENGYVNNMNLCGIDGGDSGYLYKKQ